MHGCSSTSVLLVTAEFSSMGGVVEGEVGVADKTSPRRAAIEKVQAEIRRESDYREKRKRELEFLENGGDPLEFFNDRNASTVSVQSTSFTDQHPDQLLISEAKGSFALTASPHGDSVDSSGRLGANSCEPNSADNLMLFGAENEFSEGQRNSFHPKKSDVVPSETLSQLDGTQRTRRHGDSVSFGLPRKAYKRRNRSRPNRDGTRSSSSDVNPAFKGLVPSLASLPTPGEVRETVTDVEIQNIPSNCNSKPESQVQGTLLKMGLPDIGETTVLASGKAVESTKDQVEGVPVDAVTSEPAVADHNNLQSHPCAVETSLPLDSGGLETRQEMEEMPSAVSECEPSEVATQVESLCQINGCSNKNEEGMKNDDNANDTLCGVMGFNSEIACPQESISIDGLNDSEMCTELKNADSNGNIEDQVLVPDGLAITEGDDLVKEKKVVDSCTIVNAESSSAGQTSESALKSEVEGQVVAGVMDTGEPIESESGQKPPDISADNPRSNNENTCNVGCQDSMDTSASDLHDVGSVPLHAQTSSEPDAKLEEKIDEDSILKEAQIIEAKRKKIAELSFVTLPKQLCAKSQWDYVLEEMAWLANDFAQERVWKLAAAAQISTRAAFTCCLRKKEKHSSMEAKKIAGNLSKSIMDFWCSAEDTNTILKKKSQKDGTLPVHAYAVRFMNYNKSNIVHQDEGPQTPDRVTDMGIHELSWEESSTDGSLFYTVPSGAMKIYRNSVESQVLQFEKIGNSLQEEVDTSACDVVADVESQDNVYDEYDLDASAYDMPMTFEGSKSSRTGQKKRKHLTHAYRGRSCEVNSDVLYAENKVLAQQSVLMAERPGGNLNVSIPTKRVRTASRRVISPFSAGTSGCVPLPSKTDASSGDTNSFQDDQSTLHGGSFLPNSVEVQSVGEYEKQLPIDSTEISTKLKKKKKPKHLNAAYEPRWQVDVSYQNEQKDHLKKSHPLDVNGSSGSLGQHMQKKPKTMRQSLDNSFENITPVGASAPSPVASQVSNNPNQFIKMLGGRDRNRKPKAHKMLAGQPNSGGPWTLFEDQALVVLAHDLGPNWDLVGDAINSTMKFKCIFRKAKECKERHNFLMDRTADGAEDSGSSQPYPCSLPGIPQGSARQLFQRLQGPMEEDAIKSHFEKIIMIEQRHHHRKTQDPKQLQQPHSSHAITLSIACPNGRPFNPVELCDAKDPEDIQVSSSGGFAFPNQGTVTPMHPMPGTSTMLQGSANMSLSNNFSSAPGSLASSVRDVRYGVPRPSLSADEQRLQLQQYNQMMSGRNIPQPNISAPGALPGNNHGVRILPSSNGVGLACGVNRNMPVSRNGYQGIGSSSIVNSGGIVSPGVPSGNMHSGAGSGQGTSMLRPRQAMHVMRPGLNQDSSSQMPADLPMQVPLGNSQGLSHFGGLSPTFPNPAASPPVSSYPTHQPSHPMSPQQPQVLSPHHSHIQGSASPASNSMQAYTIRLAKERRFLQLQQQQQLQQTQFPPSSLMPHAQSPSQVPVSSPVQNSSQIQSQAGSPPVPPSPLAASSSMNSKPQHPQKQHQIPTQGVMRNAQTGTNQTSKQRQRQQQQFSPANRQHPQVRQQPQAQQPAKAAAKGVGRGNPMMHQNASMDPSLVNGVPLSPGNQSTDKGEAAKHLMQNKSFHSGTTLNAVQSTKQFASSQPSNQSMPQQKLYPGQAPSSAKHQHQLSNSDSNSQGHVQPAAPVLSAGHQSSSLAMAGPNQQQTPPRQKVYPNQSAVKRAIQSNRRINSDPANKPQVRDSDCDQHLSCSSAEMDTVTTLPQASKNATNAMHVTPGSAYHWHASEPLLEPNSLNSATNLSSLESMPSNSNEPASHVSQGLGQRPLPASLPSIRNDVSAQWQQPPSQLQLPNSPVQKSQQQPLLLPPLQTQQQEQLLQAGNGNLYGRNGDHRLE